MTCFSKTLSSEVRDVGKGARPEERHRSEKEAYTWSEINTSWFLRTWTSNDQYGTNCTWKKRPNRSDGRSLCVIIRGSAFQVVRSRLLLVCLSNKVITNSSALANFITASFRLEVLLLWRFFFPSCYMGIVSSLSITAADSSLVLKTV